MLRMSYTDWSPSGSRSQEVMEEWALTLDCVCGEQNTGNSKVREKQENLRESKVGLGVFLLDRKRWVFVDICTNTNL